MFLDVLHQKIIKCDLSKKHRTRMETWRTPLGGGLGCEAPSFICNEGHLDLIRTIRLFLKSKDYNDTNVFFQNEVFMETFRRILDGDVF